MKNTISPVSHDHIYVKDDLVADILEALNTPETGQLCHALMTVVCKQNVQRAAAKRAEMKAAKQSSRLQ